MTENKNYIVVLLLLFAFKVIVGQHLYQQPKVPIAKSELIKIIGPTSSQDTERKIRILWVYGYDKDHIAGAHDYVKIKDLMVELLSTVNNVSIHDVFNFPNEEQFESADLVIMYLHLPQLEENQFNSLKNFISNGGGVVTLHETAIMRPSNLGKKLSECLGFAWNEGTSKWGAIFDKINIKNEHPVFKGFPKKLAIIDEFYWDLYQEKNVKILGTVRTGPDGDSEGPVSEELLSEDESPVFWTYRLGEGKVFGTTAGHHTFTYYDPEFRIILFRAIAWVVNEKPDPFMNLVFEGITNNEGMVGITDDLRYWEGKIRE
ncbi:MAG: ThuA domain-containing protein [Melioribacteraceae bacterium]|nr:ThuA domain-containing protein [Melioribacteraceae bacterium]